MKIEACQTSLEGNEGKTPKVRGGSGDGFVAAFDFSVMHNRFSYFFLCVMHTRTTVINMCVCKAVLKGSFVIHKRTEAIVKRSRDLLTIGFIQG